MQPILKHDDSKRRTATGPMIGRAAHFLLAISLAGSLGACVYNDARTPRSSRSAAVSTPPPATAPPPGNIDEDLPPPSRPDTTAPSRPPAAAPRTDDGNRVASPPDRRVEPERKAADGAERKDARRPEPPPAKAPPTAAAPGGRFYVEAGAYSERRRADRERGTLDDLGAVRVKEIKRNGRSYFSVAIGPVANAEQGDRLLARVVRRGYNEARVIVE